MGRLTTHVLDTAAGKPAQNLLITLDFFSPSDGDFIRLKQVKTNQDGRCDQPLLEGDEFKIGKYRLTFFAGNYFEQVQGLDLPSPKFIDHVPLDFGIADEDQHYHVPLLVSPFSYSTYRGS